VEQNILIENSRVHVLISNKNFQYKQKLNEKNIIKLENMKIGILIIHVLFALGFTIGLVVVVAKEKIF
jgi:hypothetical protein